MRVQENLGSSNPLLSQPSIIWKFLCLHKKLHPKILKLSFFLQFFPTEFFSTRKVLLFKTWNSNSFLHEKFWNFVEKSKNLKYYYSFLPQLCHLLACDWILEARTLIWEEEFEPKGVKMNSKLLSKFQSDIASLREITQFIPVSLLKLIKN